jgi:hypothetical protein
MLNDIPIWTFYDKPDSITPAWVNVEMQNAVLKSGGSCKLTLFEKRPFSQRRN